MQKILSLNQVSEYTDYLDDQMIGYLETRQTETFEDFENFDLMAFDLYYEHPNETENPQILIYIDHEDLFIFCSDSQSFNRCTSLLPSGQSNEKALYLFFVNLLKNDNKHLDDYETEIVSSENEALHAQKADFLTDVYEYRKNLLHLKQYYGELNMIMDNLTANDNELLSRDAVRSFTIILNRVERFYTCVTNLWDYVTQMREACQSQLDLEQNNLMRIFTVVTGVFTPLMLIAGWYGMNFKFMPELGWKYGYIYVIVLTLAIFGGLLVYFKHKKWF